VDHPSQTGQRVGVRRNVVPGPPGWGVGREDNNPTPEKFTVTKPPEPIEDHGGYRDPYGVAVPVKKKKKKKKCVPKIM
jgi:hypothetical protein